MVGMGRVNRWMSQEPGGNTGGVQKAETGHSSVSWANGPGGVLAQEEGRVMEARGPGGWAEGVTWRS